MTGWRTLRECLTDLEAHGQLVRVDAPVDPYLELAAIQRRAFRAKAPALLFTRVKGTSFPVLTNLFGTRERLCHIFRHSLPTARALLQAAADPAAALRGPWSFFAALPGLPRLLPRVKRAGPQPPEPRQCWMPLRARRFAQITAAWRRRPLHHLPLVYSEDPDHSGPRPPTWELPRAGWRARLARRVGLHYQIIGGWGVHHATPWPGAWPCPCTSMWAAPPASPWRRSCPCPKASRSCASPVCRTDGAAPLPARQSCPCPCLPRRISASAGTSCPASNPKAPLATMWATTA